jgi:hypothetical protein
VVQPRALTGEELAESSSTASTPCEVTVSRCARVISKLPS